MYLLQPFLCLVSAMMCLSAFAQVNVPDSTAPAPQKEKVVYLFSGLGADYRAFDRLRLPGYSMVFIEWIMPEEGASIAQYAARIKSQITTDNPILIGLSFGGMVAVEVAKLLPVEKVVLISSAKTRFDLPVRSSFFWKWRMYKAIPGYLLRKPNFFVYDLFGVSDTSDKQLLAAILKDTDTRFFRWAMDAILDWQNEAIPDHLLHIHGTLDKIIPYASLKADYGIEGGGHFMVVNQADTISRIILDYLK
jgi:pimeloyl-ACP methyl ester carboxylesterase